MSVSPDAIATKPKKPNNKKTETQNRKKKKKRKENDPTGFSKNFFKPLLYLIFSFEDFISILISPLSLSLSLENPFFFFLDFIPFSEYTPLYRYICLSLCLPLRMHQQYRWTFTSDLHLK